MGVPIRLTTKDLELFPDPLDDTRYELIDGALHVSKQPRMEHQFTCTMISSVLTSWSQTAHLGVTPAAPGVVFTPEDAVAPDVVWISTERLRGGLDEHRHWTVAPELVIEVLSPGSKNEHRDRELKLGVYSRYGVREYWIVDTYRREVAIYRRRDTALHIDVTLLGSDAIRVLSCPASPALSRASG
jgi:Uma2 family endonuclease